jgi:choline dehydrogenase-like flavoprotein
MSMNNVWDYIVVGAGSAGCIVASRLSEDPNLRVLVVEAGPPPKGFWLGVPAGMARLISTTRFNWSYMSEPVPGLNGRRVFWPRGKTLGGSSAINGMVYTRGNRRDYDHWLRLGNSGWSWDDVLPCFKSIEDNAKGPNAYRGSGGPLKVGELVLKSPAILGFVEAAHACGYRLDDDLSVSGEEGVGLLQATIYKGVRQSAYDAFLAPVRSRPNLTILTDARTLRVTLDDRVATGVEVLQSGEKQVFKAAREVIVCAGAVNSPHLLMLSGIGEGNTLQHHGIRPLLDLPGVGKNLQDHYSVHVKAETKAGWSYNPLLNGWRKYREGARYLARKDGYLAVSATPAAVFVRSSENADYADLEIGFRPITFNHRPSGLATIDGNNAISANVYRVRPASRGKIALSSADPLAPPLVHPNYMSASEDLDATVVGMREIRRIFAAEPLASIILKEISPGPVLQTDEQLSDYVLKNGKTAYHPVGTCKMGADPLAVVDARLRVRGMERLRVIDASIMPTITSGNTNAPAMMIGEKGAAMVRADMKR